MNRSNWSRRNPRREPTQLSCLCTALQAQESTQICIWNPECSEQQVGAAVSFCCGSGAGWQRKGAQFAWLVVPSAGGFAPLFIFALELIRMCALRGECALKAVRSSSDSLLVATAKTEENSSSLFSGFPWCLNPPGLSSPGTMGGSCERGQDRKGHWERSEPGHGQMSVTACQLHSFLPLFPMKLCNSC